MSGVRLAYSFLSDIGEGIQLIVYLSTFVLYIAWEVLL